MVYKYGEWTLYCIDVPLWVAKREQKTYRNYFFSKKIPEKGTPCDMPEGYKVTINNRSGMPLLKKNNEPI